MSNASPGWYEAPGDAPGTTRYWDGTQWIGDPQPRMSPAMGASMPTAGGHNLADPWARMGARVLDVFIILIPMFIIAFIAVAVLFESGEINFDTLQGGGPSTIATAFFGFVWLLWDALWVHFKGGTPGKLMLGLKVIGKDGEPVAGGKAFLRAGNRVVSMVPVVSNLVYAIGFVSLVLLFAHPKKQTLMDLIAGTVVVKS